MNYYGQNKVTDMQNEPLKKYGDGVLGVEQQPLAPEEINELRRLLKRLDEHVYTADVRQFYERMDAIARARVLVIGDIMLDHYEWCSVKRISPEAPVPVASINTESYFLGGAGNVANNVHALGAHASLISVVGNDAEGDRVRHLLKEAGVEYAGVITEVGRPTTLKRRIVAGTQQLLRIDREVATPISEETKEFLRSAVKERMPTADVVVISDYCKGIFTDEVIAFIKDEASKYQKRVIVDSKNKHLKHFTGVFLIKPNKEEAEFFTKEKFDHHYTNLERMVHELAALFQSNVVITLGADGMALCEYGQFYREQASRDQQVYDVSGAGDTVLAAIASVVAGGGGLREAVRLANLAASHVVSRLGISVCTADTLKALYRDSIHRV